MERRHHYRIDTTWTGNRGSGTSSYRAYGRDNVVRADGKLHELAGSSDRTFHGDRERWNPENCCLQRSANATCSATCTWHPRAASS